MNSGSTCMCWESHENWVYNVRPFSWLQFTTCWLCAAPAISLSASNSQSRLRTTVSHKYDPVHLWKHSQLRSFVAFPFGLHPPVPSSCSRHTRDVALGPAAVCSLVSRAKCCLFSVPHPAPPPPPTPPASPFPGWQPNWVHPRRSFQL